MEDKIDCKRLKYEIVQLIFFFNFIGHIAGQTKADNHT